MVQERLGLIGRFVVGLIGLAWTVATFLVVPVLVSKDVGPVDAVRHSVELLKRSWGENLIGQGGIGVVFGLLMFAAVLLGALLVGGAFALHSIVAVVVAVVVVVLGFILLGLIQSALQGIYAAALYRYAEAGEASVGFDQALLQQAFAPKKK
jgi:small-conductance mechanosensitive channel